jgi:triosephosphate isomerase
MKSGIHPPLIAGNWKMNGSRSMARDLIADLVARSKAQPGHLAEVLICPPAPYISLAVDLTRDSRIAVGAQDCDRRPSGAHTGDVSAGMLADCGARYVILGHSERRADHGETSEMVVAKAKAAIEAGLTAIVCVGETLAERDQGRTLAVVEAQLEASVPAEAGADRLVIAYEPVWAIGTGRSANAGDVNVVHAHLRKLLMAWFQDGQDIRLLYGGSVKSQNAAELLGLKDVNGALVGGASLKSGEFWTIALAAG